MSKKEYQKELNKEKSDDIIKKIHQGGKYMIKKAKRICVFYASDEHLINILLPYINNQKNELNNIETIFEKDFENVAKKIIKINGNNDLNKINWRKSEFKLVGKDNIIIAGNEKFVKRINEKIKDEKQPITIINCYCILNEKLHFQDIIENHDYILTTR